MTRRMTCYAGLAAFFLLAWGDAALAAQAGQSPSPADFFTPEQVARGKAYRFENRVVYFLSLAAKIGALALLLTTRLGGAMRDLSSRIAGHRPWLTALLFSAALLMLLSLVSLPTSFYSGHVHEHAYGLSTRGPGGWLMDYGKSALVSLALFSPAGLVIWALIRRFPGAWWLPGWGAATVGSILLVTVAPVVIDPLFHTFRPIRDEGFRRRALDLAGRAGVQVEEVLEMDASARTRRVNAYFTGLGRTKRIVIYDTLLKGTTPDEATLILAHEMGHWRRDHIWKGIAWSCLGTLIVLVAACRCVSWAAGGRRMGLAGKGDPLSLVLVMLLVVVLNFLSLPAQNAISRGFERQADMDSLTLTDAPDAFVEAERKLALTNLADVTPGRVAYHLFYTHPSVMERIGMALTYKRSGQGGLHESAPLP